MGLFSKKQEVNLEDFCRDFYDTQIFNQTVNGADFNGVLPKFVEEKILSTDSAFANIDSEKLKEELIILRLELFALAWVHEFGYENACKSAIAQSIFTKKYLHESGRDDTWNGMEHYNKAIAHATLVDNYSILKKRADLMDEAIEYVESNGIELNDSIGRPVNRMFSEKAWKKRTTAYFLILAFCQRLGLGYGKEYRGPNKEAQFQLQILIKNLLYEGAKQSWDNVQIKV